MKEIDLDVKKSLLDELNNAYTEVGSDHDKVEMDTKRNVGNNGYTLGQTFTLTGKLKVVTSKELKSAYLALETEEGLDLSLQRVMGISSMKGYSTTEAAINVVRPTKTANPIEETVTPEVANDFKFEDCWQPETRDLYDMAAIIRANAADYKGRIAEYKGVVVRQIEAKKDSKQATNGWKKGDKRAMTAQMWVL